MAVHIISMGRGVTRVRVHRVGLVRVLTGSLVLTAGLASRVSAPYQEEEFVVGLQTSNRAVFNGMIVSCRGLKGRKPKRVKPNRKLYAIAVYGTECCVLIRAVACTAESCGAVFGVSVSLHRNST